jgi:hypothetical protein
MTKQELQKIIDDAPDEHNHITECDGYITYLQSDGYGWSTESEDYFHINEVGLKPLNELSGVRSLADIQARIDLMIEVEVKNKRIAELENKEKNLLQAIYNVSKVAF